MASVARLVRASQAGDQEAFGRIVRRYQCLVCAVTYSSTGDLSASEDLAQETFITAWKKLDSLRDPSRLRGWLCAIARNLALQWHRQRQGDVISGAVSVEQAGPLEATTPTPVERSLSEERASVVWGALNEMPEEYRIPLILYYREQQSVGRVAEALDLSRSAVKLRLMRGRSMLKDKVVALVEDTLKSTRPGDTFAVAVVAALAGVAGKKAAGAGSTILGLSLTKAAVIGTIAVGAAVGGGLALQRLAARSQTPGAPPPPVAIEAPVAAPAAAPQAPKPEAAQPTTFNSQVAFRVCIWVGREGELLWIGETPSGRPLTIPPGAEWYVEPRRPVDMEKVRQELETQKIPGLMLVDATDGDLEYLKGLTSLQWLRPAFGLPPQITDAGLEHLEGLTGLRKLDLAWAPITDAGLEHLKGLTALEWLQLGWTQVTDAGLEHLKGLTALQTLVLCWTGVTDAGLEHLKGLTSLRQLCLVQTKVTDAGLEHLKGLKALQRLELGCPNSRAGSGVTDAGLEHLKGLTALQKLDLRCAGVTDAGLERLKGFTALQELNLGGVKITNRGLQCLKGLTALKKLSLYDTQITDEGLEHLKGFAGLELLDLRGAKVTDAGLAQLKGLTGLRQLMLAYTPITDAGLEHLKGLTGLQSLWLDGTKVTDAGLVHLKGLTALRILYLSDTKITDAALEHLKGLTALRILYLSDTKTTDAGIKELEKFLPNVRVQTFAGGLVKLPTGLHGAALAGNKAEVERLLAGGADVNARDDVGRTPLHFAAEQGRLEVAQFLLSKGADVNAEDKRRCTPLHLAAQGGHREVSEALLKAGAEVNAVDAEGWTPTGRATQAGHKDLAAFLAEHGGVE
jgi:RNA polymerase sigma factor (sigma-70 family)